MRNRCNRMPLFAPCGLGKALATVALLLAVLYVPLQAQDEPEKETATKRAKKPTEHKRSFIYRETEEKADDEACTGLKQTAQIEVSLEEETLVDVQAALADAEEEVQRATLDAESISRQSLALARDALREAGFELSEAGLQMQEEAEPDDAQETEQDTTRKRRRSDEDQREADEARREADEARLEAQRERQQAIRERSQQMQETIRESLRESMKAAEEATRAVNEAMRSLYEEMGSSGYSKEGDLRGHIRVVPAPEPAPRAAPRTPRTPEGRTYSYSYQDAPTPPNPPATTYGYGYSYGAGARQGDEVTKQFLKEFKLNAGEKLELRNKYGMVNVTTWPQNDIKVDVQIKVFGYTSARSKEILEQISIQEQRAEGKYSFITTLGNNMSNWGRGGFEINYNVSLPAATPLIVSNAYGNVYMGPVSGPLDIVVKYGKLKADDIKSENANISLYYSAGTIESMQNCSLLLKYSKCNLETTRDLKVTNDYSKLNVAKVGLLNLVSKYGDIEIESIRELDGTADYSSFDIGKLDKVLRLQAKYITNFNLAHIPAGFELIDLRSKFSSFNLNFAADANFSFDTNFRYGDLRYPKEITKMIHIQKDDYGNSSKYEGTCGETGKKPGRLTVISDYGDVRIVRRIPK